MKKSVIGSGAVLILAIAFTFWRSFSLAPSEVRLGSGEMFDRLANFYDFCNRWMSLGYDQSWRRKLLEESEISENNSLLDLATGTADVAIMAAKEFNLQFITGLDPSAEMLRIGREKVKAAGFEFGRVSLKLGNAENLNQFESGSFDRVTMSFGIRNVQDRKMVLTEIHRVLKTGGICGIMEFSAPSFINNIFLNIIGRGFVKYIVPVIGGILSGGHMEEYRYLEKSIFEFPKNFSDEIKGAGLRMSKRIDLMGGSYLISCASLVLKLSALISTALELANLHAYALDKAYLNVLSGLKCSDTHTKQLLFNGGIINTLKTHISDVNCKPVRRVLILKVIIEFLEDEDIRRVIALDHQIFLAGLVALEGTTRDPEDLEVALHWCNIIAIFSKDEVILVSLSRSLEDTVRRETNLFAGLTKIIATLCASRTPIAFQAVTTCAQTIQRMVSSDIGLTELFSSFRKNLEALRYFITSEYCVFVEWQNAFYSICFWLVKNQAFLSVSLMEDAYCDLHAIAAGKGKVWSDPCWSVHLDDLSSLVALKCETISWLVDFFILISNLHSTDKLRIYLVSILSYVDVSIPLIAIVSEKAGNFKLLSKCIEMSAKFSSLYLNSQTRNVGGRIIYSVCKKYWNVSDLRPFLCDLVEAVIPPTTQEAEAVLNSLIDELISQDEVGFYTMRFVRMALNLCLWGKGEGNKEYKRNDLMDDDDDDLGGTPRVSSCSGDVEVREENIRENLLKISMVNRATSRIIERISNIVSKEFAISLAYQAALFKFLVGVFEGGKEIDTILESEKSIRLTSETFSILFSCFSNCIGFVNRLVGQETLENFPDKNYDILVEQNFLSLSDISSELLRISKSHLPRSGEIFSMLLANSKKETGKGEKSQQEFLDDEKTSEVASNSALLSDLDGENEQGILNMENSYKIFSVNIDYAFSDSVAFAFEKGRARGIKNGDMFPIVSLVFRVLFFQGKNLSPLNISEDLVTAGWKGIVANHFDSSHACIVVDVIRRIACKEIISQQVVSDCVHASSEVLQRLMLLFSHEQSSLRTDKLTLMNYWSHVFVFRLCLDLSSISNDLFGAVPIPERLNLVKSCCDQLADQSFLSESSGSVKKIRDAIIQEALSFLVLAADGSHSGAMLESLRIVRIGELWPKVILNITNFADLLSQSLCNAIMKICLHSVEYEWFDDSLFIALDAFFHESLLFFPNESIFLLCNLIDSEILRPFFKKTQQHILHRLIVVTEKRFFYAKPDTVSRLRRIALNVFSSINNASPTGAASSQKTSRAGPSPIGSPLKSPSFQPSTLGKTRTTT